MASLSMLCDRVLWLDHGRVCMLGKTEEAIAAYQKQQTKDIAQLKAA